MGPKKTDAKNKNGEIASTVTQLHKKIDELSLEYQDLLPGDPRREQIANEISTLGFELERLKKKS